MSLKQKIKSAVQLILLALITAIAVAALRVFLFASVMISSSSMEPTLLPGDFVLVNKLTPGPRLNYWFCDNIDDFLRLTNYPIKRNDVLLFNRPYYNSKKIEKNLGKFYVKRCLAIPNDTFYIEDAICKVKNCHDTLGYYPYQEELLNSSHASVLWSEKFGKLGWNIVSFGSVYVPGKKNRSTTRLC